MLTVFCAAYVGKMFLFFLDRGKRRLGCSRHHAYRRRRKVRGGRCRSSAYSSYHGWAIPKSEGEKVCKYL